MCVKLCKVFWYVFIPASLDIAVYARNLGVGDNDNHDSDNHTQSADVDMDDAEAPGDAAADDDDDNDNGVVEGPVANCDVKLARTIGEFVVISFYS